MAMTIVSQSNSESIVNFAVIRATTDAAAAAAASFNFGFIPRWVRVTNLTNLTSDEWYEGMAPLSSVHAVAAGTTTLEPANSITVSTTEPTKGQVTATAKTMVVS